MHLSRLLLPIVAAGFAVQSAQAAPAKPVDSAKLAQWRNDIRTTLFIPASLPALQARSYGTFSPEPGIVAERILYSTTYGLRVPVILYRPENPKGKVPGFVIINGHGGDKYSWYATYTGILFARAGAFALTYDPIGEGESNVDRKSHTRAHDQMVDDPNAPRRLTGFMVAEAMQGVSYLLQRPEVDTHKVSLLAYSMGSYIGALTGAVDTRIDAVVLSAGGNLDGPNGYWDTGKKMCQGGSYTSLIPVLGDRGAIIYALNQQRGPTFIMNGTVDNLIVQPNTQQPFFDDLHRRVVALSGTEKNIFETYWFPGAGHRPSWDTRPSMLWIEDHIGLPNWTRDQIIAMPETHVGEWIAQNHLDVEKTYLVETSEAGIRALGTSVPALSREQLSVLSDAQWQKEKESLIYETWLSRALAADTKTAATAGKP